MTDIYPAGEEKIQGISSEALYNGIKAYGHRNAIYIPDKKDVPDYLDKNIKPGDMVITLGAGNIWQVAEELVWGSESGVRSKSNDVKQKKGEM